MSQTKKDLANNISKKLGLSKKDSLFLIQHFFKILIENKNKHINISNFGTFIYKKTPTRIGRNPKTLQEFKISSRQKLTFKPSDEIKKNINWKNWSGWPDLNRRPPHPQCGALPGCATSRFNIIYCYIISFYIKKNELSRK